VQGEVQAEVPGPVQRYQCSPASGVCYIPGITKAWRPSEIELVKQEKA